MSLLLFQLWFGHALADYGFQSLYVAQKKNPDNDIWGWPLLAHCLIHGGFVMYFTGFLWLGIAEVVAHGATDYAKGKGWFGEHPRSYHIDQSLHYGVKIVWAFLAITFATSLT